MSDGERFLVFFVVWVGLAVLGVVGQSRASPETKVRWYPRYIGLAGALFVALTYWATRIPESLYFTVPAAVLFTFLNIKLANFCRRCGYRNMLWGRGVDYCYKCGLELSPRRPRHQ
jgi:hypothetical protein